MLNKMVMAAALVIGFSAHAQSQSEFFYQTPAGKSDLTPRIGYISGTQKGKSAGAQEYKTTGLAGTGVSYEYGINEMFSLGGSLYYSSIEVDTNPKVKASGISDPTIYLKGTNDMGAYRVRFGAGLGMGIEKMKVDSNGNPSNLASGGFSLKPYFGIDGNVGGGILGGGVMYTLRGERTVDLDTSSQDAKITDGNVLGLTAFYEAFVADMLLGGQLNYDSYDTSKIKDAGDYVKSHNTLGISLYSRIPFGTFSLIPKLDYDFSHSEMDKYDNIALSVAGRFTF